MLTLNGEQHETQSATVAELLREWKLDGRPVAVMINGEVIRRAQFDDRRLSPNDNVDLISLIGGG